MTRRFQSLTSPEPDYDEPPDPIDWSFDPDTYDQMAPGYHDANFTNGSSHQEATQFSEGIFFQDAVYDLPDLSTASYPPSALHTPS